MLTSPALSPRATERRAQELIHEFLLRYFQGPRITAITAGTPGTIECSEPHALQDGQVIHIANVNGGTPLLNGRHTITAIDDYTLALDVDVTTAGTLPSAPSPLASFTRPHLSLMGDATFPWCELFYNQASIPAPAVNPQIHVHFSDFRPSETWFAKGNLSDWQDTLATPGGGVSVGLTTNGQIEEAVHGRVARSLPGDDYRMRFDGDGAHEEIHRGGDWVEERLIADARAIRWRRTNDYLEEALVGDTWTTVRTINVNNALWDGDKKLVTAPAIIIFYVRVANAGADSNAAAFLCRGVADHLKEIFQSPDRSDLAAKGMRGVKLNTGPSVVPTTGWQQYRLSVNCQFRYYLPR